MKNIIALGAIKQETGEYVYPKMANKADLHICPECKKELILCKGKIRIPYFRHKAETNPCQHYENPGESEIHKEAKKLLEKLLQNKIPIEIKRNCNSCKKLDIFNIDKMTENSSIKPELIFEFNGCKKIADIAYLDNGIIKYIFEIMYTHKTCENTRPDPWFEINAKSLIQKANDTKTAQVQIDCERSLKCRECTEKDEKNKMILKDGIDIKNLVWLKVSFKDKDQIKEHKGKWNPELKLWYITKSYYQKNKNIISDFAEKIIWIGSNGRDVKLKDCADCQGSGYSYWTDDVYGCCLFCCCINCEKFNYECTCHFCEVCETTYLEGDTHLCDLCIKCKNNYVVKKSMGLDEQFICNLCIPDRSKFSFSHYLGNIDKNVLLIY